MKVTWSIKKYIKLRICILKSTDLHQMAFWQAHIDYKSSLYYKYTDQERLTFCQNEILIAVSICGAQLPFLNWSSK